MTERQARASDDDSGPNGAHDGTGDDAMAGSLEDHNAIRELTSNYSSAASAKDDKAMELVFTEDARVLGVAEGMGMGGPLEGPKVICGFFGKIFEGIEHLTQMPHVANIRVDGDLAASSCDIVEFVKRRGAPGMTIVTGRYEDKLRRTPAGWRFYERTLSFKIFQGIAELPQ
jgi:ketosteroid isomerase-like protein